MPQVCYHPQLGPIQTCDTCMVEVDGELVRACATPVVAGMKVETDGEAVDGAQREAFDRILRITCSTARSATTTTATAPSTTRRKLLDVEHQDDPVQAQAVRGGRDQSVLSLRPRPVHSLRALRRGLPERAGQRDAVDPLGGSNIRACCGMAARRSGNRVASPAGTASRSARAMR